MSSPSAAKYVGREKGDHLTAATPPGSIYWDADVLREELERFFFRSWLNVGREEQIPEAGDFLTLELGDESVLVIRGSDGRARAFYNLCRHRGTRLVNAPSGKKMRSIVCPYHAWAYSSEGALVGAPHTEELVDFRKEAFGLHPVALESWGGFLWINLDDRARSLREDVGDFLARFERFPLADLRSGSRRTYDVQANWKILVENYSECYHCAPIHPELNRVTPYLSGEVRDYFVDGASRRAFSGGTMEFSADYQSMTWSGYTKRPPLKGMEGKDLRSIYYYAVFPNLFFSLHPDFLMIHRAVPLAPDRTRVECDFLFDPETMARPDFDPSDAVEMWDLINRQDWNVCELTQKGMRSRAWKGGRYSSQEPQVHDFDSYVMERLGLR
ncbi:MAG: aromatic ring-hydroxylating oxygenase subunit alpha [Methanobacteriota archaeon]